MKVIDIRASAKESIDEGPEVLLRQERPGDAGPELLGSDVSDEHGEHVRPERSKTLRKWLVRLGILAFVTLSAFAVLWYRQLPPSVTVVRPQPTMITETIVSSGIVGGTTETNVGAQSQGIVAALYVEEGSNVTRGQPLALIKNDVAEAQVAQARVALNVARAQLELASRGALGSDIDATTQQVSQANAQVEQQRAAIAQAERSVLQATSILGQLEAERSLAKKNLDRSSNLVEEGIISRQEHDQALTAYQVADKRVEAQTEAIRLAQSNVRSAQAALKSSEANLKVQEARLRTIRTGARPEDVRVARQRVEESEKALSVAEKLAGNALVTAPFAGVVTKINAEVGQTVGQTVGTQGVLTLVSVEPEIRLDVDESNLSSLRIGQEAVISSGAFSDSSFEGTVSELGAAVDQTRGTIEVKIVPINPPEWLRPGQTVNVNIVTARDATRLLVPQTALTRSGDSTVVFVVVDGRVAEKPVVTRQPTKDGVPVLAGLGPDDRIIVDAAGIKAGQTVTVSQED